MLNILYFRKESGATLLVGALSQDGRLVKYKFPGILKSKNRNALFLSPATVWDITLSGNVKEYRVPKEFSLHLAPYDASPSYTELFMLGELLQPLGKIKSQNANEPVFECLYKTLQLWRGASENDREYLLNRFYLEFLEALGLLHFSSNCVQCAKPVDAESVYALTEGSLCPQCLSGAVIYKDLVIPALWLYRHMQSSENLAPDKTSKEYRKRILHFIELN